MNHPYKILIATDYSAASKWAEIYACQLAAKTHSLVSFIHVYEPPLPPSRLTDSYEKILKDRSAEEQHRLEEHSKAMIRESATDQDAECKAVQGSAAGEILKMASSICADVIVVGTHGTTGQMDLLLGSHTWSVMHKSGVPVLAVPPEAKFGELKKIIWAAEGREGEWPGLKFSAELVRRLNLPMESVHVRNGNQSGMEKFRRKAQLLAPESPWKEVEGPDVIGTLRDYARQSNAGLIIVSHERILWLQKIWDTGAGVTKRLSRLSELPILSVPDHYHPEFENFWRTFSDDSSADEEF